MLRASNHGFTLIETIIAVVVLGIAIPSMLWSIQSAHQQRVDPMLTSKARWLAQEKIEDVIADRHSAARGYAWVLTSNYATENPVSASSGFTRSVTVAESSADLVTAGAGYKTITVTVGWTDSRHAARSLSIATVVTDY
jgi:prepilin-type N-terminal cleavage/methylation domain-containing protein